MTLKLVPKATSDSELVPKVYLRDVYIRKSTSEREGKPEQQL